MGTKSNSKARDSGAVSPVSFSIMGTGPRADKLLASALTIPGLSITTSPASADGILVAAPLDERAAAVETALTQGRPVFVGSPVASTRADAARLVALAAAENLPLYVGSPVRRALETLGLLNHAHHPHLVECIYDSRKPSDGLELDPLFDLMMGDLDAALALFSGAPVSLRATRLSGRPPRVDAVEGRVRCRGVGEIRLRADRNASTAIHVLRLHFADGLVEIDLITGVIIDRAGLGIPAHLSTGHGLASELTAFAKLVSGEERLSHHSSSAQSTLLTLDAMLHLQGSLRASG